MTEKKSTQRLVRSAPTEVVHRALTVYNWLARVGFLGLLGTLVTAIWLRDWRWLATAGVVLLGWALANAVADQLAAELDRREDKGDDTAPVT